MEEAEDAVPLDITSIRQIYKHHDIGQIATKFLVNDKRFVPQKDYEAVDDIMDIVGPENMEILREFVEIAMMVGITRNGYLRKWEGIAEKAKRRESKKLKNESRDAAMLANASLIVENQPVVEKKRGSKRFINLTEMFTSLNHE